MKVANMTAMAMNHGFTAGLPSEKEGDESDAVAITRSEELPCFWNVLSIGPLSQASAHDEHATDSNHHQSNTNTDRRVVRIGNFHDRNDRFTRSKWQPIPGIQWLIKDDLYRNTLDDLHVIACCIFGRKQTESSSTAGLNAIDAPAEFLTPQRVHFDLDWLAGSHLSDLIFLEVGADPDLLRHQREQVLSSLDVGSGFDRFLSNPA